MPKTYGVFRELIDNLVPDPIWEKSERLMVVFHLETREILKVNPQAEKYGFRVGQLWIPKEAALPSQHGLCDLLQYKFDATGTTGMVQCLLRLPCGREHWVMAESFRLENNIGYFTLWIVDETVQAMEEAKANREALERLLAQVIRKEKRRKPARVLEDTLTATELNIVTLLREGKTSNQIADQLHVTVRTVEFHRGNIRRKLGVPTGTSIGLHLHQLGFTR
jgi:DNA-binding CsgD family transcriptional regulator